MKVYVAGPMRGVEEFNFPEFEAAAKSLRRWGYEVLSPAEHDRERGFNPEGMSGFENLSGIGFDLKSAFSWDAQAVLSCDALCLLPDWQYSAGARAEIAMAAAMGMKAGTLGDFAHGGNLRPAEAFIVTRGVAASSGEKWLEMEVPAPEDIHPFLSQASTFCELNTPEPRKNTRRAVLNEAADLIDGDRERSYGSPRENFANIAAIFSVLFPERTWTPGDITRAMLAVKLARTVRGYKRDTAVDMAGYAGLYGELEESA